ncbi:MAG: carbon-nitrogen hydrolase family protein [Defluviitaleaceae bacterium]|nr:carbon-nitrogen hydrolase family protein [Defluviitaleaceae bacterium]
MRKVTLAAAQAGDMGCDKRFDCLSADFIADPKLILKEHVLPRLEMQKNLITQCQGADLTLTIEDISGLGYFLLADKPFFDELATISFPVVEAHFSKLAMDLGMHIAACYVTRIGTTNYNVTSIFGRCGNILGQYKKTHIPPNEMWHLADGDELNVIDLDFGKIGVLICYDMMFPEAASVLAAKGAEVILHPTAGYGWYDSIGEATLRTRANDNSMYILTAKNYVHNGAGKSSLIDPWGQVLVDAGFYKDVVISKTIDLDVPKTQPDWFYQSQMSGFADIRKRYPKERRPELYGVLSEKAERLAIPDEKRRDVLREKVRKGECRW